MVFLTSMKHFASFGPKRIVNFYCFELNQVRAYLVLVIPVHTVGWTHFHCLLRGCAHLSHYRDILITYSYNQWRDKRDKTIRRHLMNLTRPASVCESAC